MNTAVVCCKFISICSITFEHLGVRFLQISSRKGIGIQKPLMKCVDPDKPLTDKGELLSAFSGLPILDSMGNLTVIRYAFTETVV